MSYQRLCHFYSWDDFVICQQFFDWKIDAFAMLMPGRHGYASQSGWATGEGENGLPGSLTVDGRTDNEPDEYKATEQVEFIPGFESELGDVFDAFITEGSGSGSGSGMEGSDGGYRYGFNGKENDNEVKGEGNQQDYGMRIYDPRIAKFLSVDPLQEEYPELTPYQFASNTPVQAIDQDGLEKYHYTLTFDAQGKASLTFSRIENFTETRWNPGGTGIFNWWLWEKVENPRKEYLVTYNYRTYTVTEAIAFEHDDAATVKYDQDPTKLPVDNVVRDIDNRLEVKGAQQAFMQGVAGNLATGLKTSALRKSNVESKNENPSATTSTQAKRVNNGNPEVANVNNSAKPTISYEGTEYEIKAAVPYERPKNSTTVAQRKAVNQANAQCATCGSTKGPFIADHKLPLAIEHISTGTIDKKKMRSIEAVQSQCQSCSKDQSAKVRKASQEANKQIKKNQNGQSGN